MLPRRWAGVMKGTRYFAGGLCKALWLIVELSGVHCGTVMLSNTTIHFAGGLLRPAPKPNAANGVTIFVDIILQLGHMLQFFDWKLCFCQRSSLY